MKTDPWLLNPYFDDYEANHTCFFGVTESIVAALVSFGIGDAAAAAIGAGVVDSAIGAGGGALFGAITGGNVGKDALGGAITGGAIGGFGGELGDLTGSAVGGDALAGAAGGALGAGVTGTNPLTGAALGGVSGGLAGLSGGASPTDASGGAVAGASGGGGLSAAGGADISPVAADPTAGGTQLDLTTGTDPSGGFGGGGGIASATPYQPGAISTSAGVSTPIADTLSSISGGSGSGSGSFLKNNASWLLPAAPLALTAVKQLSSPAIPFQNQLTGAAADATGTGESLIQEGISGTLPPGEQSNINTVVQQQKAQIRQQYASLGLSGSTMETQALNDVDTQAQNQAFQYSQGLINQGSSLLNMGTSDYSSIASAQLQQDDQLSGAISNFANAAGLNYALSNLKQGSS